MNSASSTSCVMKKIDFCAYRCQTFRISSCAFSRVNASSAPSGSSISMHLGVAGQRPGDADALLHAAGEDDRPGSVSNPPRPSSPMKRAAISPAARASGTPRILSPKATLSRTLSQGSSACFWNTTARSAPGPSTGLARRAGPRPLVGPRNPAIRFSSVDLATARCPEREDELAVADRQIDPCGAPATGRASSCRCTWKYDRGVS